MHFTSNLDPLSPDQYLEALAAILAAGILRLHARNALNVSQPDSDSEGLDVPAETVLSVCPEVNGPENLKRRRDQ